MLARTHQAAQTPELEKVFCFFSSEKKTLLSVLLHFDASLTLFAYLAGWWPAKTRRHHGQEAILAGDLSITPAALAPAGTPRTTAADAASIALNATPARVTTPATQAAAASTTSSTAPPLNPGLHLDLALNLVVLQFFDSKGNVTQTIPSQKQLEAYQADASSKQQSGATASQLL